MNLNNFTIKSQDAVQSATQEAMNNGQQAIETGHILKGVLNVDENVTPFLLKKLGVNLQAFQSAVDSQVKSYPKISGGQPYLSGPASQVLNKATNFLKEFGDEYVSIEHLLLALLHGGDTIAQLMKDSGVTEKGLKTAITELRKGGKVNSQTAEDTYNALGKYALHLNQLAKDGKLDPCNWSRRGDSQGATDSFAKNQEQSLFLLENRVWVKPPLPKDWRTASSTETFLRT
jgi:ATP-dependent Clp protease ATP-binding subunit ClpB